MSATDIKIETLKKMEDEVIFISFIWCCTKFLTPKVKILLLSYKSKKAICFYMEAGISSS